MPPVERRTVLKPIKPYSESCDQNREPILAVLRDIFAAPAEVLEIGSGTGQHAVYFPRHLPHLHWQPSDRAENLPGVQAWRTQAGLDNVQEPLELDVLQSAWPDRQWDGMFSANTAHIMSWPMVEAMFRGVGRHLRTEAAFVLYGPMNHSGSYSSPSNARFDAWLKERDPASGIRDVDALRELGQTNGLGLEQDIAMPVNNRSLVWRRQ